MDSSQDVRNLENTNGNNNNEAICVSEQTNAKKNKEYKELTYNKTTINIRKDILNNLSTLFKSNEFQKETKDIAEKYFQDNNLKINNKENIFDILLSTSKFTSPVQLFTNQISNDTFSKEFNNNIQLLKCISDSDYYNKLFYNIKQTETLLINNKHDLLLKTFDYYSLNRNNQLVDIFKLKSKENNINNLDNESNIHNNYNKAYNMSLNNISSPPKLDNPINKRQEKNLIAIKKSFNIELDEFEIESGYTTLSSSDDSNEETGVKNTINLNNANYNIDSENQSFNNHIKSEFETPYSVNQISSTYNKKTNLADIVMNLNKYDKDKMKKTVKNQITIDSRTNDEKEFFKLQEIERYKYPHLPWKYYNIDGSESYIVCPIVKKAPPFNSSSKPRDHEMLKKERPGFITILCLARDAASKLKNSVGTRADICDLIKDSYYINHNVSENQINIIVSGALDRLHYEKDPCVKYDAQQKLWMYLHGSRDLNYPSWSAHLQGTQYEKIRNPSESFDILKDIVIVNKVILNDQINGETLSVTNSILYKTKTSSHKQKKNSNIVISKKGKEINLIISKSTFSKEDSNELELKERNNNIISISIGNQENDYQDEEESEKENIDDNNNSQEAMSLSYDIEQDYDQEQNQQSYNNSESQRTYLQQKREKYEN